MSKELNRKVVVMGLGIVLLQAVIVPYFEIGNAVFDLTILFVAFFAFAVNYRRAIYAAFLIGFARDLFGNAFFGLEITAMTVSAVLLNEIIRRFDREDEWVQISGTFLFCLAYLLFYNFLLSAARENYVVNGYALLKTGLVAIYTTLLAVPCFSLFRRFLFGVQRRPKQYELF